ncbi:DUF2567 domain-containing protein [Klenkia taihuensis]|uniref:LPXTG-motif cell wall anchor domain-containing protein n=1 Tax=Klenkia taihuensis TaxID=1225127 RepID=A0A1I1T1Q8_9ACTN|nr:DUF2567 domain-containing protein [Klenkia taihuensis]GHE13049.1 hypothetical protein GCM10011381_33480 [Klenkia taihuensis]SFD52629.1 LPXTG-motif cell wall anchor domain-containing protein [Klenkia taihuensis]
MTALPPPVPSPAAGPQPVAGDLRPAAVRAGVPGLRGSRGDVRGAVVTAVVLAVLGLLAGLLWVWLAPRAQFTVTSDAGDVQVAGGGLVDPELFASDDGVYVLLLGGLGLLAGVAGWLRRRRRGVVTLVGLAVGMLAASVAAWQLGALLGRGPSREQLTTVGTEVTTALDLNMLAALAVGPFCAVLVYVVCTVLVSSDDLGRDEPEPAVHPEQGHPQGAYRPEPAGQAGPAIRE